MHLFFSNQTANGTSPVYSRDESRSRLGRLIIKKTGDGTCGVTLYEDRSDAILIDQDVAADNPAGYASAPFLVPGNCYVVIADVSGSVNLEVGLDY
jgi:hypothetical protein